MVSECQRREMVSNLGNILKELSYCNHIKEISCKLGIPKSTIQRYLNREDLYLELLEDSVMAEKVFKMVQDWLVNSKVNGNKRGGCVSQDKYLYSKGDNGYFNGMKSKFKKS